MGPRSQFGTALLTVVLVLSVFTAGHLFSQEGQDRRSAEKQEHSREGVLPDIRMDGVKNVEGHFSREEIERGRNYRGTKYRVFFLRSALSLLFLFLVARFGWIKAVGGLLPASFSDHGWIVAGIYAVVLSVAIALLTLPLNFYSGYIHEHSFGLSTRALPGWFSDLGKYVLLQMILSFLIFAGLYLIMKLLPGAWWMVSALTFILFLIGMATLSPLVIDPLFNEFSPLEDRELEKQVIELSEKAGVEVDRVYEMDASTRTRKLNAYFTGMGRTKRVVLYDTLLRKGSREEIMMVVAHELGHWRRDHLWKGVILAGFGTFIVMFVMSRVLSSPYAGKFGIGTFNDPSGVPLVLLIVLLLGYISMPVQNYISRHFERQADMDSLVLTQDPDTFIRVEEKMGRINLNDVDPDPVIKLILFTHPPTMERIRMGEEFKRRIVIEHPEEKK